MSMLVLYKEYLKFCNKLYIRSMTNAYVTLDLTLTLSSLRELVLKLKKNKYSVTHFGIWFAMQPFTYLCDFLLSCLHREFEMLNKWLGIEQLFAY